MLSHQFQPAFNLFKDTSGTDRVRLSNPALGDLFLIRSAQGEFIEHAAELLSQKKFFPVPGYLS